MLLSVSEKPVVAKNTQNTEAGDWLSCRVHTQFEGGPGFDTQFHKEGEYRENLPHQNLGFPVTV